MRRADRHALHKMLNTLKKRRAIEELPGGRFLVALMGTGKVLEVGPDGKTQWEAQVPGCCHAIRLPSGNTLITFSTDGEIREVTASGAVVQTINANYFGYANYRESLYGPPLPY